MFRSFIVLAIFLGVHSTYPMGDQGFPGYSTFLSELEAMRENQIHPALIAASITKSYEPDTQTMEDTCTEKEAEIRKENLTAKAVSEKECESEIEIQEPSVKTLRPAVIVVKNYVTPRQDCKICQQSLSVHAIPYHMKRQHPETIQEKIFCDECGKLCDEFALGRHKANCHTASTTRNYYICNVDGCGMQFTTRSGWQKHSNSHRAHLINRDSYTRQRLLTKINIRKYNRLIRAKR